MNERENGTLTISGERAGVPATGDREVLYPIGPRPIATMVQRERVGSRRIIRACSYTSSTSPLVLWRVYARGKAASVSRATPRNSSQLPRRPRASANAAGLVYQLKLYTHRLPHAAKKRRYVTPEAIDWPATFPAFPPRIVALFCSTLRAGRRLGLRGCRAY